MHQKESYLSSIPLNTAKTSSLVATEADGPGEPQAGDFRN